MPTPVERLDKSSGDAQTKAAISDCIAMEMNNGMPQDQAVAMCHEKARGKTGKELAPKGGS